jgi:hypothetical protein
VTSKRRAMVTRSIAYAITRRPQLANSRRFCRCAFVEWDS